MIRMEDLNYCSVKRRYWITAKDKKITSASLRIIDVLQESQFNYDEAKEALDFTNQVLLNKLLNKSKI